ncbi:MAG: helix-turn-helix transcriptional regulator [Desulfuromonadales bacterium]|nr:helix-turn-helix transcriptional regulator [Desulfuromonadales bacterium]
MSYKPVSYHPKKKLEQDLQDSSFKQAWEALDDEFAALDVLLKARKAAGLTQEQVAAKMGVSQPSLARVEASLGSHRHSPSLEMLRKYAAAVNCKLEIKLVPQHS